jgi:hypothetical protein
MKDWANTRVQYVTLSRFSCLRLISRMSRLCYRYLFLACGEEKE